MALNEAGGPKRSNLTREQREQAEAAIYGFVERPMANQQFSPDDIERMRTILAQHDSQKQTNEFDLNNPPKERYVHQEFPRMVYHHEERKTRVVKNAAELHQYLAEGWSKDPYPMEAPAPALDAASSREAAAIDKQIAELNKKKGSK